MCYDISYYKYRHVREAMRDGSSPEEIDRLRKEAEEYYRLHKMVPRYSVSGFSHPDLVIYTKDGPEVMKWGLIPFWAKNRKSALAIWNKTLNCRQETMFDLPSYKASANVKKCVIPVDAFYEHYDFNKKKYPFLIKRKDGEKLWTAGLYSDWLDKETGELVKTFTLITTKANETMKLIHNEPDENFGYRMPAILESQDIEAWLEPTKTDIDRKYVQESILRPYNDELIEAFTVRRIKGKESLGDVPEAMGRFEYEELLAITKLSD